MNFQKHTGEPNVLIWAIMFLGTLNIGLCGGLRLLLPGQSGLPKSVASHITIPTEATTPTGFLLLNNVSTSAVPSRTRIPPASPSLPPVPIITASSTPELLTDDLLLSENKMVIGYSTMGRPLEVYQFGEGENRRMIVAGIHGGNEYNTIALAEELIRYAAGQPDLVPADTTLFILRSLNPDGEARGRDEYARATENEVDLNRNFPALWQNEWDRDNCWNTLHLNSGSEPGSEPETQALMSFVLNYKVDALINYHSAALGIFPGGQPPDPGSLSLAGAISSVSSYPYPPIDTGCIFSGQLIDWASLNGVAAVDIELANHQETDFEQNLGILNILLAWRP